MLCIVTPLHLSLPCSLICDWEVVVCPSSRSKWTDSEITPTKTYHGRSFEDPPSSSQVGGMYFVFSYVVKKMMKLKKMCEFMYVDSSINQVRLYKHLLFWSFKDLASKRPLRSHLKKIWRPSLVPIMTSSNGTWLVMIQFLHLEA